jgi:MFS family permease
VPAPPARSPWLAFSAVAVGNFMATLDGSIVNVALPVIGADVGAGVGRVEAVITAFLATAALALLPLGRLGDRLGHRRVYVAGLAVFTAGSALCGLAGGLGALVAARAVQALGAAAMMSIGPAVVTAAFPGAQRGRAIGAIGSVVAIGLTVGPPLGGLVTQLLSWRWIFLVNLPVGLLGVAWALRALPPDAPRAGPGAAPAAFLGLDVLRLRPVSIGLLAGLCSYAAMFASTLLTPFYLARVRGLAPGGVGAVLIAVPVAMSVASPVAGWLSDRFGTARLPALGAALLGAGLGLLSLAGPADPLWTVAARLALCGLGMGLIQAPNNSEVMGALPRDRLGAGGGLIATARSAGMVLGVEAAGLVFALRAGEGADAAAFLGGFAPALRAAVLFAAASGLLSLATRPGAAAGPARPGPAGPPG